MLRVVIHAKFTSLTAPSKFQALNPFEHVESSGMPWFNDGIGLQKYDLLASANMFELAGAKWCHALSPGNLIDLSGTYTYWRQWRIIQTPRNLQEIASSRREYGIAMEDPIASWRLRWSLCCRCRRDRPPEARSNPPRTGHVVLEKPKTFNGWTPSGLHFFDKIKSSKTGCHSLVVWCCIS